MRSINSKRNNKLEQTKTQIMKNTKIFAVLLSAVILASCGTSHDVVDGGIFQKRKYNKGYHVSKKTKVQTVQNSGSEDVTETIKNENSNITTVTLQSTKELVSKEIATSESAEQINSTDNVAIKSNSAETFTNQKTKGDFEEKPSNPTKREKRNKIANKILSQYNLGEIVSAGNTSADGSLLNIILAIVLIVAIIMVLSFIDGLLGGLLGLVLLIIIIVLLLRYFGII